MTAALPDLSSLTTRRANLRQARIVCDGGRVRGMFRWARHPGLVALIGQRVFVAPVGTMTAGIQVRVWDRCGAHLCDADYEQEGGA